MEQLASEIFSILKGANYKLRLFTAAGIKTMDPEEATRFYAYDQDLMVSIRHDEAKTEVVVQAGAGYDIPRNEKLLNTIKASVHKNLGEYTVRKFNKSITPKDFAHQSQSMSESAFSKAFGSIKTSYVMSPNAKLIIKHSKGVDESVKGSRSRNIHSLFIESGQGEKFAFPFKYMSGAKAMTMHVSEGGTPYDQKGKAILAVCEEIADLSKFVKHTRSNKLVNETNEDIVAAIRNKIAENKTLVKSLSTKRGYNNFQESENIQEEQINVDITEQFLYDTFTAEEMQRIVSRVNRIVSEAGKRDNMQQELISKLYGIIQSGDLGMSRIDRNDPEHPNNEDPAKYSGQQGAYAKLASMLSFIAKRTTNDELSNVLGELSENVFKLDKPSLNVLAKFVMFALKPKASPAPAAEAALDEHAMFLLRKKIA